MYWIVLIIGVALWWAAHLFKRVAPARRAAMGDPGKGAVAATIAVGIVLMVIGYRGTGADVTSIREAESERARTEAQLRAVIESSPIAITIKDVKTEEAHLEDVFLSLTSSR